jgi:hypothetical protein
VHACLPMRLKYDFVHLHDPVMLFDVRNEAMNRAPLPLESQRRLFDIEWITTRLLGHHSGPATRLARTWPTWAYIRTFKTAVPYISHF